MDITWDNVTNYGKTQAIYYKKNTYIQNTDIRVSISYHFGFLGFSAIQQDTKKIVDIRVYKNNRIEIFTTYSIQN